MQPSTLKSQPLIADKGRQDEVEEEKKREIEGVEERKWKRGQGDQSHFKYPF